MDCPSCHNNVSITEANYGALYTCSKCQAVYFINFDGRPEFDHLSGTPYQSGNDESSHQIQGQTVATQDDPSGVNDLFPSQPESQTPLQNAMTDIENFANQDVEPSLTFNLIVTGLDSKATQSQFYESINDSKFGWMAEDIIKSISQGRCEIKNIKPVSAHVLAKRLRFMDVQLEWIFANAI